MFDGFISFYRNCCYFYREILFTMKLRSPRIRSRNPPTHNANPHILNRSLPHKEKPRQLPIQGIMQCSAAKDKSSGT